MKTLKERIESLCNDRNVKCVFGPITFNVMMQQDADNLGPYIRAWNIEELGPIPIEFDGFSVHEIGRTNPL